MHCAGPVKTHCQEESGQGGADSRKYWNSINLQTGSFQPLRHNRWPAQMQPHKQNSRPPVALNSLCPIANKSGFTHTLCF